MNLEQVVHERWAASPELAALLPATRVFTGQVSTGTLPYDGRGVDLRVFAEQLGDMVRTADRDTIVIAGAGARLRAGTELQAVAAAGV